MTSKTPSTRTTARTLRHCGHHADCTATVCFRGDLTTTIPAAAGLALGCTWDDHQPASDVAVVVASIEVCALHLMDALTDLRCRAADRDISDAHLAVHAVAPDRTGPLPSGQRPVADHLLIATFSATAA